MRPTVLIAGAGPTGLTLACELARRGVPFRIVEAVAGPQAGSRGKGIQPRTLEVFDDLGVVDRVLAHGRVGMPMRMTAPDGTVTMANAELPKPSPDIPYPGTLVIPEWRVEEALRLRLEELGGAVEFGTALVSFHQSSEGVSAVLRKGEVEEIVWSRWLVGCDGGHSTVRKQAGISFEGDTLDQVRMIVADVKVDELDRDAWHVWSHKEGMVSLCPLPSTNVFQYQVGIGPGQNPDLSLENMQSILEDRSGRDDLRLHDVEWSSLWRANIRIVDRYREGDVFLAGDAAHIHSPAGGQGMNTGIQDAQNLGWKLAAVAHGASVELLETYEKERRPIALGVLALSNARLREAMKQKGIPTHRDPTTMQLGIRYRDSWLSRDDRDDTASLRAGDRAPDASGILTADGTRRLFELLRGGVFTVLNFGPVDTVAALPPGVRLFHVVEGSALRSNDVTDSEGHLAKAYEAVGRTLVLIRPDGYVGVISDVGDFAMVSDYFAALGYVHTIGLMAR